MPVFAWTAAAAATELEDDADGYSELPAEQPSPGTPATPHKADWSAAEHHTLTEVMESKGEHKVSTWQAGVVFFKSCIGVGILGMPFAFRNSGMVVGVLSVLVIALVTNIATKLLVWNKRHLMKTRNQVFTSIPDMAEALYGPRGLDFANLVVIACQLGTCIAYNIFLGVSLTAIVEELYPTPQYLQHVPGYNPYIFFVGCQCLLFCMLVQLKDVASMSPLLMIAQVAMVIALGLVIAVGFIHPSVCDRDGTTAFFCKIHAGARWDTFPVFVGITVFAMEGVPTLMAIEHAMADPARFEVMLDRVQALIAFVFIVFGCMGYWLYGNNTRSVITLNIPGMWGMVVKMFMVIVTFLSYPLQFIPLSQIMKQMADAPGVQNLYDKIPTALHHGGLFGKNKQDFAQKIWGIGKIAAVFVTGMVAISVPHFGHVLSLLGSVTFSTITFVIPPLLYLKARQGEHTAQMVIMCLFLVMFGAAVTSMGLWSNMTNAGVWKHKIEKAPPRPGSHTAVQAHEIYKKAEGMTKQTTPAVVAGAQMGHDIIRSETNDHRAWKKGGTGWAAPPVPVAPHKSKQGVKSVNQKKEFYREAESVGRLEGMPYQKKGGLQKTAAAPTSASSAAAPAPATAPATSPVQHSSVHRAHEVQGRIQSKEHPTQHGHPTHSPEEQQTPHHSVQGAAAPEEQEAAHKPAASPTTHPAEHGVKEANHPHHTTPQTTAEKAAAKRAVQKKWGKLDSSVVPKAAGRAWTKWHQEAKDAIVKGKSTSKQPIISKEDMTPTHLAKEEAGVHHPPVSKQEPEITAAKSKPHYHNVHHFFQPEKPAKAEHASAAAAKVVKKPWTSKPLPVNWKSSGKVLSKWVNWKGKKVPAEQQDRSRHGSAP